MFTITKQFEFSASHVLYGLPSGHQCGRLHGHNYVVEVELQSYALDETGFVLDYGKLKPFKDYIDSTLDHRHLNDVWPAMQPSAELMAQALYEIAVMTLAPELIARGTNWDGQPALRVSAVRVKETPKTCSEFRP